MFVINSRVNKCLVMKCLYTVLAIEIALQMQLKKTFKKNFKLLHFFKLYKFATKVN